MFLALLLAAPAAPVPPAPAADWKPAIKNREFQFEEKNYGAARSVEAAKKAGLTAEYQPAPDGVGEATLTFQKKGCPKLTVGGHEGARVVVHGDALYVADYHPSSTGCKVVAYDLNTGKRGWETRLVGIGPIDHFKYRNRVAMAVEKHPDANHSTLVIVGWESSGRYVEVLDLATGKQLAHKKYENEK